MEIPTGYSAQELTYLSKAKDSLKQSRCQTISAENVLPCVTAAAADLLRFNGIRDYQVRNFNSRKKTTSVLYTLCGDPWTEGFGKIGIFPFVLLLVMVTVAIVMLWKFLARHCWLPRRFLPRACVRMGPMDNVVPPTVPAFDIPYFMMRMLSLIIVTCIAFISFWSYGTMVQEESQKLALAMQMIGTGKEAALYQNAEYVQICRMAGSSSIGRVYRCSQGIDTTPDEYCSSGKAVKLVDGEQVAVMNGLQALVNADIQDFDSKTIVRNIHAGITYLKQQLSPKSSTVRTMSSADLIALIRDNILPLFMKPSFRASSPSEYENAQLVLLSAADDILSRIYVIVQKNWPQLDPLLYMDIIDQELTDYFEQAQVRGYYGSYVRDIVLTICRSAVQKARDASTTDGRFTTAIEFERINWPRMQINPTELKLTVTRLFINIGRYNKNFVDGGLHTSVKYKLSTRLLCMYLLVAEITLAVVFIIYMIYLFGIKNVAQVKSILLSEKNSWYFILDLCKYFFASLSLAMFLICILDTMRKKRLIRDAHNTNTIEKNTYRLRTTAWNLLQSVYPVDCSDMSSIERDRRCNVLKYQVCTNGGKDLPPPARVAMGDDVVVSAQQCPVFPSNRMALYDQLLSTGSPCKDRIISLSTVYMLQLSTTGTLTIRNLRNSAKNAVLYTAPKGDAVTSSTPPTLVYGLELTPSGLNLFSLAAGPPTASSSGSSAATATKAAVVAPAASKLVLWSAPTQSVANAQQALLRDDGALVVLDARGVVLYSSQTASSSPGAAASAAPTYQNDGTDTSKLPTYQFCDDGLDAPPPLLPAAQAFYANAIAVIRAYESCNLIAQNNTVPFPFAEFSMHVLFVVLLVMAMVYITLTTGPFEKLRELRDIIRLRHRLRQVPGGSIPSSLRDEIEMRMACSPMSHDIMRILTFTFVIVIFILTCAIVHGMNTSSRNFKTSLASAFIDDCI